ncbi:p21-activated protein kinase-interacting protein 1-like protein [Halocaridina rubra]|uniref:P21-activated protein kinase-interacting protein 1-like protein n=1 Tax=Halocaridina rubra TaxID=373956 RepID=A0AAN8XED3_HALRR
MNEKTIEIVLGTNEEYILGYSLHIEKDGKVILHQDFADHSHIGSVRQVAIGGQFLASGGTDEHIKVFDIENQKEVGTLMEHEGTVTYLGFFKSNKLYLFSASEDGKICIFNSNNWQCEKTLKGHKGGVVSVSIHPSGKIALSLGRDKKLRTWNLIKGRKAYITHIDSIASIVHWSPSAENFVIVKGSFVDLYDVASCKVKNTVNFKESVTALLFITDDIIAVAAGDKNICFYDISNQIEILQWEAHSMRVKCLRLIPRDDPEEPWLVSASSDGYVKIWKLQLLSLTSKPVLLGEVDTTCRIICMDIFIPSFPSKVDLIKQVLKKEKSDLDTHTTNLKKKKNVTKVSKVQKVNVKKLVPNVGKVMLKNNKGDAHVKDIKKSKLKNTKRNSSIQDVKNTSVKEKEGVQIQECGTSKLVKKKALQKGGKVKLVNKRRDNKLQIVEGKLKKNGAVSTKDSEESNLKKNGNVKKKITFKEKRTKQLETSGESIPKKKKMKVK